MKAKLLILTGCLFLLAGCTNMGGCYGGCCYGGCGGYTYYDYGSQCGLASCTDQAYITNTYTNAYAGCGYYGLC